MMFDTFARTGAAEFPFPREVVFRAVKAAVGYVKGATLESFDEIGCRAEIKTGISAFSWGERIVVSVSSGQTGHSVVTIGSGAKTIFGSATTHGKNNKNVSELLGAVSAVLKANGEAWNVEAHRLGERAPHAQASIADELGKLAILLEGGILTKDEFDEQKRRLLG